MTVPELAGQGIDPKTSFIQALAQFSLALDGTYGDEGSRIRSSLDAMDRGLDEWDRTIGTAEAAMPSQVSGAEPQLAARMHAALGGAYLDRGRFPEALREFAVASRLDPSRSDILALQGLILSDALNQPEAAAEAFQKASSADPRNPVRWYVLARHYFKIGKPEVAKETLALFQQSWEQGAVGKGRTAIDPPFSRLALVQEKSRVDPFFPPVRYAQGFALLQRADYTGAIAQFREAAKGDPLAAHEKMEAMGRAAAAFRDGSLQTAVGHLKVAIELEPNFAEPHRILGAVYLKNQQPDDAIDELKTAVGLDPADERTRLALADALVEIARYPEAEQTLRQVIDAVPASGRARYVLGRLHQRQGHYEDALRAFGEAVTFQPLLGLNGIYQSMGAMNAVRQNFDAALDAYLKRVEIHPNDAEGHQDLGDIYSRLGRHDEALAEFAMVLMLAAGRPEPYAAMAQVHLRDGRYAEAVETSRRALDLDGNHSQARYTLAISLLRLGKTDEGQKELEAFQRLQAEAAAAHARELELGGLRREASESSANGDHQQAVSLLRRALALAPDAAVSHLNLGLALLYAGQPAEAIERFMSAVLLNAPLEVHLHLAQAYAALGQPGESRRELAVYEQMRQDVLRRAGAQR